MHQHRPFRRITAPLIVWMGLFIGDVGCELNPQYKNLCRYDGDCVTGYHCDEGTCLREGQVRFPDLDTENAVWQGVRSSLVWVLYTYASSAYVLLDLRETRTGPTRSQYSGSRQRSQGDAYRIETSCVNGCEQFGNRLELDCSLFQPKPQLVCGSLVFDRVRAAELPSLR
ncbi:MAG: hypothetical protein JNJ46_15175 [Myxococcales bacterium]|nr:hypothetical protein [Myxococcales bacterium]